MRRRHLALAVLILSCLAPSSAQATAEIVVRVLGGDPAAELTVTLETDGRSQNASGSGDTLVLTPSGTAGDYQVAVRAGTVSATAEVSIPESGLVTLTFNVANGEILTTYTSDFGNEELVVTARRREESLQVSPVSVSAFTEMALKERSLRNLNELGDFVPNVDFSVASDTTGSPTAASVFIRGIGSKSIGIFQDPGVGIYVDGVYLARAQGSVFDLLDLERVEVLRGPQGTLFGKNTLGGAINMVTRKPSGELAGELELVVGDLDRRDVRGRINAPFSDKIFGSLAGLWTERDGYARSLATGEELNDDDRTALRGALRFLAADNLVVDLTGDYTDLEVNGLDQVLTFLEEGVGNFVDFYNQVMSFSGFPTYSQDFVSDNLFESYSASPNRHAGEVYGLSLNVDAIFGGFNLTSITSYREIDLDDVSDRDGVPLVFVAADHRHRQSQFSQELQLHGLALEDRLTWLIGGLYFTEDASTVGDTVILQGLIAALGAAPGPIFAPPGVPSFLCNPGPPPPGVPCFGGPGNPLNFAFSEGSFEDTRSKVDSYALFGQASFSATDKLSLTFGLRYSLDEKEVSIDQVVQPLGFPIQQAAEDDWDALSPKVGFEAQLSPDHLLYGSISWGFKSGGFNGIVQGFDSLDPFDPEEIIAYELGFKSDWLDNRLRLNAAAFFNDYTDIQFTVALIDETQILFPIRNAGEAESQGFELELSARPNRTFQLNTGLGYLDTEYTELKDVAPGGATLDGTFPKAPEWTFNLSPQLSFGAGDGELRLRADYSYRSKIFHDITNHPSAVQEGFSLVNARLAYFPPSDRWEVALFGTNLTDERYSENGVFTFGFGPTLMVAGPPREWGVSVRFDF